MKAGDSQNSLGTGRAEARRRGKAESTPNPPPKHQALGPWAGFSKPPLDTEHRSKGFLGHTGRNGVTACCSMDIAWLGPCPQAGQEAEQCACWHTPIKSKYVAQTVATFSNWGKAWQEGEAFLS